MLNAITINPQKALRIGILIILGLSLIGYNDVLDLQFFSTYGVLKVIHLGIILSIFLSLLGWVYRVFYNSLFSKKLILLHIISSISLAILYTILGILDTPNYAMDFAIKFSFLLLVLIQFLLIANIVIPQKT